MDRVEIRWLETEEEYDGSQLRSHWIFDRLGLLGDAAVGWLGSARVAGDALVDRVDARAGDFIYSPLMLHFISEHFQPDLELAVWRQRLLVAITAEVLGDLGAVVRRQGDDLYVESRKLSVSIATRSLTSGLIHLGLNVSAEGAPVPAVGLRDLGLEARRVGEAVLYRYQDEVAGIRLAVVKVRGVP